MLNMQGMFWRVVSVAPWLMGIAVYTGQVSQDALWLCKAYSMLGAYASLTNVMLNIVLKPKVIIRMYMQWSNLHYPNKWENYIDLGLFDHGHRSFHHDLAVILLLFPPNAVYIPLFSFVTGNFKNYCPCFSLSYIIWPPVFDTKINLLVMVSVIFSVGFWPLTLCFSPKATNLLAVG